MARFSFASAKTRSMVCERRAGTGCFAYRRMPDVLRPFRILLPDRADDRFGMLLVLYAPLPGGTALADIAFVFPIPFPVGGGITENLVLRAQDTAVGLSVHIRIPGKVPFPGHWPPAGERWDSSTVKDLLADPWRFVPRIRCYDQSFRIIRR